MKKSMRDLDERKDIYLGSNKSNYNFLLYKIITIFFKVNYGFLDTFIYAYFYNVCSYENNIKTT